MFALSRGMTTVTELFGGVLRLLPNTLVITLFVIGIAAGRLSWILIAIGGVLVAILTITFQYLMTKTFNLGYMPGTAFLEACSVLPVAGDGHYAVPSMWMTLSAFFLTYIVVNAAKLYTVKPKNATVESLAVQQRKGVGLISMFAVMALFLFMLIPRYKTSCETLFGTLMGIGLGVTAGWIWWGILNACGPDVYPDIHGVMIGLNPGKLRTNPQICQLPGDTETGTDDE